MRKILYTLAIVSFFGLTLSAIYSLHTSVQAAGERFTLLGTVTKQDRRVNPWINTPIAKANVWIYDLGLIRKYRLATSDASGKINFGSIPVNTAVKIEMPYPQPSCCSGIWDGLRWTAWIKIIPNTLAIGDSTPQYTCGLLSSPAGSNADLMANKRDCNNFILGLKPR